MKYSRMRKHSRNRPRWLLPALCTVPLVAQGQIITDGSLGPASTLTGPAFGVPAALGTMVGNNLFHSFRTFNLDQGQSATFSGPATIANVLSRVTGGSPSTIDGTLSCSIPGANFFFLNPAGVVFGPHASVDVGGAFAVSTADYVVLADGGRVDTRLASQDSLTTAPVSAFGFLPPHAGEGIAGVTFSGTQLAVKPGKDLTVAAGAMSARQAEIGGGAQQSVKLQAPGGTLRVAAVASAGELASDGLGTSAFAELADIALAGKSILYSGAKGGGGRFVLEGNNLRVQDGSAVLNFSQGTGGGRESVIAMRGDMRVAEGGLVSSLAYDSADAGDLTIHARNLVVSGGGLICSGTNGKGKAGALKITADESIVLGGDGERGTINANSFVESGGDAGTVNLKAKLIRLNVGGAVEADTAGSGNGGPITLSADEVVIDGQGIGAHVSSDSTSETQGGHAGSLEVQAKGFQVQNGGYISASTYGPGNGGAVTVAADTVFVDGLGVGAWIFSGSLSQGQGGDAGNVDVQAKEVRVINGGAIESSTSGMGDGGSVRVAAEDRVVVDGQGNGARIGAESYDVLDGGNAGDVEVRARQVEVLNGGYIISRTWGTGNAGAVTVAALEGVTVDGTVGDARVASDTLADSVGGDAAGVSVEGRRVEVLGNGAITSATYSSGNAGAVTVRAGESIVVDGKGGSAFISTDSMNASQGGNAGSVELYSGEVAVLEGGAVVSRTYGGGNAGSVKVTAEGGLVVDGKGVNTGISANSESPGAGGDVGSVEVNAGTVHIVNRGRIISNTAGLGSGGTVRVTADEAVVVGGEGETAYIGTNSNSEGQGGDAGDILVQARRVQVLGNGAIGSPTYGLGRAGSVTVLADEDIVVDGKEGSAIISTDSMHRAQGGDAGDITLDAGEVRVLGGGTVASRTYGMGHGGSLRVDAREDLTVDGNGRATGITSSTTNEGPGGDAGDVEVNARNVRVLDGGLIGSNTDGRGHGGTVVVTAKEALTVRGGGERAYISSASTHEGEGGGAGDVNVQANRVDVLDGGVITSATFGLGAAGSVIVSAQDAVRVDGNGADAYISTDSFADGSGGAAGGIEVMTKQLQVLNGGLITSRSYGAGAGGVIRVVADEARLDKKAEISTQAFGSGPSGEVVVTARAGTISLSGHSRVSSSSETGKAGSVTMAATSRLDLNNSGVSVKSAEGDAGTIGLTATEVIGLRDSEVVAEAGNNGGNVVIDPRIFGLENARLSANARSGDGGHISITTDFMYQLGNSSVTAISENRSAQQGTVEIRSGMDFASSLAGLPSGLMSATSQLRDGCARKNPRANSFILRGKGGVAARPDNFLPVYDLRPPGATPTLR